MFAGTDRYSIKRRLGAGGMGVVYEAWDAERSCVVALKTLPQVDAAGIYRLKKEFRALSELSHPNLVALHELVCTDGRWFFTMDLIDGTDFISHVRGGARRSQTDSTVTGAGDGLWWLEEATERVVLQPTAQFDEAKLRNATRQLVAAVAALHKSGRLHRDLKPSNVMVSPDGHLRVLDFGVAHIQEQGMSASLESAIVGTPAYMAPEQASGEQPVSEATDWYGVGVMIYEAMTGVLPFGGSLVQLLTSKQTSVAPDPNNLVAGLPDDLASVCSALLRRNPSERPGRADLMAHFMDHAPASERAMPPSSRRLTVGRDNTLSELARAFADVDAGRPVFLQLEGAVGLGKTAIVRRFLRSLPASTLVLVSRCHPRESLPFKAVDGAVDRLARYLKRMGDDAKSLLPAEVHALVRLFPVLGRLRVIREVAPIEEGADPQVLRQSGFAALKELLRRISEGCPVVLYIDDAQWGDGDSAALLGELLREPAPRMLTLVSYRSDADCPLLQELRSEVWRGQIASDCRLIKLGPLEHGKARELAAGLLETRYGPAPDLKQRAALIAREARGVPALIAALVSHGRSPIELDEMYRGRIDGATEACRSLLEVVAVAGGPLRVTTALGAAELGREGSRALIELVSLGLLRQSWSRHGECVDVAHASLADMVTRGVPLLSQVHGRLAAALAQEPHVDREDLAKHLIAAGSGDAARDQLVAAADEAQQALAFEEAARLYGAALELETDPTRSAELYRTHAHALAHAGRSSDAGDAYLGAAACFEAADGGPTSQSSDMRRLAAEYMMRSGRVEEGLESMRSVLQHVGLRMHRTPRGALLSLLYSRARLRMMRSSIAPLAQSTAEEIALTDEQRRRLDTCWSVGIGLSMVDVIHGADFHARHLLAVLRLSSRRRLARALALEGAHLASSGVTHRDEADEMLAIGEELANSQGDAYGAALCKTMRGSHCLFAAQWEKAVRLTDEAVHVFQTHCNAATWEIATARRFNLAALYYRGDLTELCARVPNYLADARARGDRFAESSARSGSSLCVWLVRGDVDAAQRHISEEARRWSGPRFALQQYLALQGACLLDLYQGKPAAGAERLTEAWGAMTRSQLLRVAMLRTSMLGLRARCTMIEEPAKAERDVAQMEKEVLGSSRARALLLRAGIAVVNADGRASKLYQAAAGEFAALGMRLHEAAALWRLGDVVGGDSRARAQHYFDSHRVANPESFVRMITPTPTSGA